MTRTVIRVEELLDLNGETRVTFRVAEPFDVVEADRSRVLVCNPKNAPFSDLAAVAAGAHAPLANELVRLVGENVYNGISIHPGLVEALNRAVRGPPEKTHPIWVMTSATDAESLPWEVLYHPTGRFLGLDPRWPIARVVHAAPARTGRYFEPPLRIAAVLAAADRDATGEWEALREAIQASQLPTEVTLFVAQDALAAHVQAQGEPWVEVQHVPDSEEALIDTLLDLRPQLMHVFSHGSSEYQGFLEIATRGHIELGDPPLYLSAGHIGRLRDVVWLVTLDACEGAMPAAELHSLAYALVKDGVPTAIGMREVIDSRDASVFCRAFYTKALAALGANVAPGARFTLDWTGHLYAARAALCKQQPGPTEQTAARLKPWTLPVAYRHQEELTIQVARPGLAMSSADQERLVSEIEVLRDYRARLHPDTPRAAVAAIEADIAALEAQFR